MDRELPSLDVAYNISKREMRRNYPDDYKETRRHQSISKLPKADLIGDYTRVNTELSEKLKDFVEGSGRQAFNRCLEPAYILRNNPLFTDRTQWIALSDHRLFDRQLISCVQGVLKGADLWRVAIVLDGLVMIVYPWGVRFSDVEIPNSGDIEGAIQLWSEKVRSEEDRLYGWMIRQLPVLIEKTPDRVPIAQELGGAVVAGFKDAGPKDCGSWVVWSLQRSAYKIRIFEKNDGQLPWNETYSVDSDGHIRYPDDDMSNLNLVCYYWTEPRERCEFFYRWIEGESTVGVSDFEFIG